MRVLLSQISAYKTSDAWMSMEETLSIFVADLAEYIKRRLKIEYNFCTAHLVRNMLEKKIGVKKKLPSCLFQGPWTPL